jgi:hypothetical protein
MGGQPGRMSPVGAHWPKALSEAEAEAFKVEHKRPSWLWPGQGHCTLDKELRRTYGLSCADYERLLEAQGGVCRRCGQPPTTRRLVVDEDHETNEVWGLLHFGCNRRIDQATRRYLRTPPPLRFMVPAAKQQAAERRRQQKARRARAAAKPDRSPARPSGYAEQIAAATERT